MVNGKNSSKGCAEHLSKVLRGKFIVVDGIDGSGKTTLIQALECKLRAHGLDVEVTRDPGGTRSGDEIRRLVLSRHDRAVGTRCETLLFMAARAQLVTEVIFPAQQRGACVLCDRFVSSTLAYQVAAGIPAKGIAELGEFAIAGCWPDLTIILDVDVSQGFERTGRKLAPGPIPRHLKNDEAQGALFEDAHLDAISQRSATYFYKVRERFLKLHLTYPTPVRVVDARASAEETFAETLATLRDVFIGRVEGC